MKKILVITSTRPDVIKLFPVIRQLRRTKDVKIVHLHTGQHAELADDIFQDLDLKPDIDLQIMQPEQTLNQLMTNLMEALGPKIAELIPDLTIVQGDTTSALAGALSSFYAAIPVAHVEAGLRSHDMQNPFPEEANRKMISTLATWHFTPTLLATNNLLAEGYAKNTIVQTGNTIVDAVQAISKDTKNDIPLPYLLITLHRREHIGAPLEQICEALKQISEKFPAYRIIIPMHPNPQVRQTIRSSLAGNKQIQLIEPLQYPEFLSYLKNCHVVITDSGGVQEEAMVLQKPLVVVRKTTERMEAIEAGYAKLVGVETDAIVKAISQILTDEKQYDLMIAQEDLYGDGKAAEKIVNALF
ncbi:MAG: non-hydrolyzing UDP-N-acetylglucosamine 2-epimerase [Weeksellaceae bacterium]